MKIKKLKINHYKNIKKTVQVYPSLLNILVGPNNAGKTNILDAIEMFFNSSLNKKRFNDKDADIECSLNISGKNVLLKNPETVKEPGFVRIGNNSKISSLKLETFKKKFPKEHKKFSSLIESQFKNVKVREKIIYNRPLERIGEGFKRFFIISFYLFNPEYKIILIDEPALHLHPSLIKKLTFFLGKKELGNQVFLTTHHPSIIKAEYLKYVWRIENANIWNYSSKKISPKRLVQEINDENLGILFSDKVLIVEGVSDKIFMKEMIRRFYKKEKDIKVIDTGGKGTVSLYASLCDIFGIPYTIMLDRDAIHLIPKNNAFFLKKDLEAVYPRKYKMKETKPLSALSISKKITKKDLSRPEMRVIKEILGKI